MRLIDADKIYPDVMTKREALAISQGQLAYAPTVEAIPQADYETRLKADMVAMLEEIQMEIIELPVHSVSNNGLIIRMEIAPSAEDASKLIQQKINALKSESEDKE